MEHVNRQSALRELLVRAWQPLLERTREIESLPSDRRGRGWRDRHMRGERTATANHAGGNAESQVTEQTVSIAATVNHFGERELKCCVGP